MVKHVIFLVHGMGVYGAMEDGKYKPDPKGWFDEARKTLKDVHDKFIKGAVGRGDFDSRFKVVPIEYDSILEHFRFAWDQQDDQWSKLGLDGGFAKAVQSIFAGNNDKAFFWTHVADVALYAAPTVREQVKVTFAAKLLKAIGDEKKAGQMDGWSVIAHSLGTAVTHDALTDLRRMLLDDDALDQALWPPRAICMAANVARAITDDREGLYADTLAPTGRANPDNYISCNHRLDPFTLIAPFDPKQGGWVTKRARFRNLSGLSDYYLVKEAIDWVKDPADLERFASAVPHGFTHYMRQPRVVSVLWPLLGGDPPGDYPGLEDTVRKAYAKDLKANLEAKALTKLHDALKSIKPDAAKPVKTVLQQLLAVLKELA